MNKKIVALSDSRGSEDIDSGRGRGGNVRGRALFRGRDNVRGRGNLSSDKQRQTNNERGARGGRGGRGRGMVQVADYYQKLRTPEQRQSKDSRSASAEYGDAAIGYVRIKRSKVNCIVDARITPETSVNNTPYFVSVTVDEVNKDVTSASCNCQASMINCKHQTALIFWLLRRSEEPSPTEIACYWKKSILSTVKNVKTKTVDELSKHSTVLVGASNTLLEECIELGKETNASAGVIRYSQYGARETGYMDYFMLSFVERFAKEPTCSDFLTYCSQQMSDHFCKKVFHETKEQSEKNQWYYLRFGRITASRIFEVSRCDTLDGSLVDAIMGSRGFKGNVATMRGQKLEKEIFDLLKSKKNWTIEKSGILLSGDMPIFGASPDAISDEFIFEIKCPSKQKTISHYIENGVLKKKFISKCSCKWL
ncbi:hypothetical protein Bhyg_12184 [Pseudolycoriella hygida]|uniref:SWIM-type domain-containing protein n=1 Tax=Pseudolycoriella hygida TaxID=35572 RepID=A0A9Q0MY50_9DIPT|nr:hypothetical protein Bhyg_12184 [Pseudolycoriella hygida]